jgi:hypothetical protein
VQNWLSTSDADGDAVTKYTFWDGGTGSTSGYFWTPSNAHHAASTEITVNASDLANVWFRGGQSGGSETLWVRAFDGKDWGAWDSFNLTTKANVAPKVTADDQSSKVNQWSQVKNWLSASDADGDAVTKYTFWDGGTGSSSGYFWTPSNAHHAAGAEITVDAADLDSVWFRGGQAAGSETLWVRAFDGKDWGAWDSFNFSTTDQNKAPVVETWDQWSDYNQWSRVTGFFDAVDPDNDNITQYRFWDGVDHEDSGYFWTPQNSHHDAHTVITVNAADINDVWFRGAQVDGADTIWVAASDGKSWSDWVQLNMETGNGGNQWLMS